jgi:hypothetical protein
MVADNEQDHLAANGAWSKEQVGWLTATAKQEARDVSLKLYIELSVQFLTSISDTNLQSQVCCLGSKKVIYLVVVDLSKEL